MADSKIVLQRRDLLRATTMLAVASGLPAEASSQTIGYPSLLQGPMVGATTPHSLTIWSRVSGAFDVAVEYAARRDFSDARRSMAMRADAANDFTTRIRIDGLDPDTVYHYRMRVDGIVDRYRPLSFRTRTAPSGPRPIRIAFGSCARVQLDPVQPVWEAVAAMEPDLFLWLGDNIYADSDAESAITENYARQRSVPKLARLLHSVPQLAIWDDHDFSHNNSHRGNPVKDMSLQIFNRWWANPSEPAKTTPGIHFRHSFGPVDIFMLDGRYHRDPIDAPDGPNKTMLGAGQKAWLKQELKASKAVFKVLASSTIWAGPINADPNAWPTAEGWARYLHERNELLDYIRTENITGCFGIAGDVHRGEANCIPCSEKGGYDFYELVSSGLAQFTSTGYVDQMPEVRLREPWANSANFGVLDFHFGRDPRVEMSVRNLMGGPVWPAIVLRSSDLRNGISSWPRMIGDKERVRRRRFEAGGSYYGPDPR